MLRCSICGAKHQVLDPTFKYPDAFLRLDVEQRREFAQADEDLCGIALPGLKPRHYVRGTLPVEVAGLPEGVHWGVWAEISEEAFGRVLDLWSDPEQVQESPFEGCLANAVPSYPDTVGLPLMIQLTGPETRPEFRFVADTDHPFARECRGGIEVHRAAEWNQLMTGGESGK